MPDIWAIIQAGNLYVYCINNPIFFIDPSGEFVIPKIILAALIKAAAATASTAKTISVTVATKATAASVAVSTGAAVTLQKLSSTFQAGKSFANWSSFRYWLGSAGEGRVWHHIVEQSQALAHRARLCVTKINSVGNIINLPEDIHRNVTRFFNSAQKLPEFGIDTHGMRFRDWLNTADFQLQYEWGLWVLRHFGVDI